MLGRKWTAQDIQKSIQLKPSNFMTEEEFEQIKKMHFVIGPDDYDFKKQPIEKILTPAIMEEPEEESKEAYIDIAQDQK